MLTVPDSIKDLLHLDSCKKNIRIHFPNGERSDICNDLIVKDSVSFKESLCSQDTLKFGLCEASVFECETVGVGNIKGATIEVSCEVYCDSSVTGAVWQMDLQAWVYSIPYGTFIVDTAKRQADMIHRRIVAYSNIYHSISDSNQNDSIIAHYAGNVVNSQSNFSTSIEELVFSTYPDLFDKDLYTYTSTDLMNLDSYSKELTGTIYQDANVKIRLSFYLAPLNGYGFTTIGVVNLDDFERNPTFSDEIEEGLEEIRQRYGLTSATIKSLRTSIYSELNSRLDGTFVELYREDYVSSSSMSISLKNVQKGNVVVFDGRVADIRNLKFAIDCNWNTGNSYLKEIKYCKDGTAYRHDVLASSMTKTSYSLVRASDGYVTTRGVSVTVEGYSARVSYQNLNIMELANAYIETQGLFVMFARNNTAKYINIKQQFGLTPSSTLYPNTNLYPQGVTGGKLLPNDYQSCWYDDDYTLPYGAIQCDYKNTNNKDRSLILYLTGFNYNTPTSKYRVYKLSGNAFINMFTWTKAQIQTICENIAANIEGVRYMPVEFVGRGLPYVEAGDTFEILTKSNDSITTIVLNRTITGELTLTDNYKSV